MTQVDALADRVRDILQAAEATLEDSLFSLELMRPLNSDPRIIDPLDRTFAAHSLNALTWTLYSRAAVDAIKAIIDKDERSASLAVAMELIGRPEVAAKLRERRTVPIKYNLDHEGQLSDEQALHIEQKTMKEEQLRAGAEFDLALREAQVDFAALGEDPATKRLKQARNKILAHADVVLENGRYRRREPKDFGLTWGDAEHVTKLGVSLLDKLMTHLFGSGISIGEASNVFAGYSEDFWKYLRTGLSVTDAARKKK